jgi:hypothetical protein
MTSPDQSPEPTLRLVMPKKRMVRFLVLAIVFVAAGTVMLPQNPWLAWTAIGFFGLGVVVFAIQIVHPSVLLLDADGFEPHLLVHRRESRRRWEDCSTFTASDDGPAKLVVYSTTRKDLAALRVVNSTLAGGDEAVQAGFGGLNATQLAELMNRYRNTKLNP